MGKGRKMFRVIMLQPASLSARSNIVRGVGQDFFTPGGEKKIY
jgi:hypothetical protein